MDKNMSQLKQNIKSQREGDPKFDKILNETNFDEDSGLGVSGHSYDYPLDEDSTKSKGPTETTKKQKEIEEEHDYFDSGFDLHSGPMLKEFEKLIITPNQPNPPNPDIIKEIFSQDEDGDTQVHIAITTASPALTKQMIECAPYPALLDIENVYGQSPIHIAVLMGESSIVRLLLIRGAKATVRDYEGNTPLHLAVKANDVQSVLALLNPISAAELKHYGISSQSHQLPKYQRIPIDLEQRNYFGENCIHIAALHGHGEILKHLIMAGADINAREGRAGYTALHIAVESQNEEIVRALLKYGAGQINVETLTYGQITAYQLASEFKSVKIPKCLEDFGCEKLPYPESDYDSFDESDMDSDE